MEKYLLEIILLLLVPAFFAVQLILCLFSKRLIFRLIPAMIPVLAIAACVAIYAANQNWGFLIVMGFVFIWLLAVAAAWVLFGIIRLVQKILKVSRKNT